jgi:hypothetical protein
MKIEGKLRGRTGDAFVKEDYSRAGSNGGCNGRADRNNRSGIPSFPPLHPEVLQEGFAEG